MKNPEEKDLLFMIKTVDSINTDKQTDKRSIVPTLGEIRFFK